MIHNLKNYPKFNFFGSASGEKNFIGKHGINTKLKEEIAKALVLIPVFCFSLLAGVEIILKALDSKGFDFTASRALSKPS